MHAVLCGTAGRCTVTLLRWLPANRRPIQGALKPQRIDDRREDGDRTRHIEGEYNFASTPLFSFSLSLQAAR